MRALRREGNQISLDARAPEPTPAPGEALIRPTLVAVGELDLALARGDGPYIDFVGTLGREFVGVVEEVAPAERGGGVKGDACQWVGRRVAGASIAVCGVCDMCRSGLSVHCRERQVLGASGRDGCFADRFCLPVGSLTEAPASVDDEEAVLAQSLALAMQATQRVHFEGKPYVTVLGDGRVALLAAERMTRLNVSVRLIGRSETTLAMCERWGVKSRHVNEVGRRADQDVVVLCDGSSAGLETATKLARPRGKIVLTSLVAAGSDAALQAIVEHELEVIGSRDGSLAEAMSILERGETQTASLVTRRMTLDEGVDALRIAASEEQIALVMSV